MNNPGKDSPKNDTQLRIEQSRRERVAHDKSSIASQLNALAFERTELVSEFRKAQNIYLKKSAKILNGIQSVIDRQKRLMRQVEKLLELDGKCFAYGDVLLTHKDPEHKSHICSDDFGHSGTHSCACGTKFIVKDS